MDDTVLRPTGGAVGRTAELSALLFGTTQFADVVADVLRECAEELRLAAGEGGTGEATGS